MNDPLSAYRQTRVKTAGQGRLIVMLYDEGLRQMGLAIEELQSSSPRLDIAHNALVKCQDVITELMVSLDFDKGGDIARNLFNLYMFFNQKLVDANMKKDPAGITEVRGLMNDLREAWSTIENTTPVSQAESPAGGVNIAG